MLIMPRSAHHDASLFFQFPRLRRRLKATGLAFAYLLLLFVIEFASVYVAALLFGGV